MSKTNKHLIVSLPTSVVPSRDQSEAFKSLRSTLQPTNHGDSTYPFTVPTFKIGTLDALVQQADELTKLSSDANVVVGKVGDSLGSLLEGDAEKIKQQKVVGDKPVEQYLQTFSWNKVKYRADKPIAELIDSLRKELGGIDNDVKSKFSQYNNTKNNLVAAQRKQTGNLSTRSLASIIKPSTLITDSEYLETHLLAVPKVMIKDYQKTYETLAPMVVPRSSTEVASDDEFTLFAVTTFKKHSGEFVHKAREKRWIPREYRGDSKEGGSAAEQEKKELESLQKEERKLWGEALRLGRNGYSEAVMTWMHIMALRVFVETVLRYGLPADFVCGIIRTTPNLVGRIRAALDLAYGFLAGNALGRDDKGRVKKDDQATQSEMAGAGHGDAEYTPYVFYEIEID